MVKYAWREKFFELKAFGFKMLTFCEDGFNFMREISI